MKNDGAKYFHGRAIYKEVNLKGRLILANVTDLNDTLVTIDIQGDKERTAIQKFDMLCSLAHSIETLPCSINHDEISSESDCIHAEFDFSCAAEKIIFQLNYQFNSKYKI